MDFLGMDPVRVCELAAVGDDAARSVRRARERLATGLASVTWQGPDAEEFRRGWRIGGAPRLLAVEAELIGVAARLREQAEAQDETSAVPAGRVALVATAGSAPLAGVSPAAPRRTAAPTRAAPLAAGPAPAAPRAPEPSVPPTEPSPAVLPRGAPGYLHVDAPWLPDALEAPLEVAGSHLVGRIGARLEEGLAVPAGLIGDGAELLGLRTADADQLAGDAAHLRDLLGRWATGQRVPTVAELGAAGLVTTGSAAVVGIEALTGRDSPLLDDRPGGAVTDVQVTAGGEAPRDLAALVLGNDALRRPNVGGGALPSGSIGVQVLRPADGGAPVYLVQVPPTEGARLWDAPEAWGGQGASRDWVSNLRLVAGQDAAAMDDVRAAMQVAGVPAGSRVMLVGHSQGGIVAARLAADPVFNDPAGAAGGYDVTHVLSFGSPVQTVLPARPGTRSLNLSHGAGLSSLGLAGDPVPLLDLQGLVTDGRVLGNPGHSEVVVPGYPSELEDWLRANHDATGAGDDPTGGYAGSIARAARTDPALAALQAELEGTYLGPGVAVEESVVVTVGRGPVGSG